VSADRSVIIKITNEAIWFNEVLSVPLTRTNLPVGDFRFVKGRTIFWKAEMINYDKQNLELTIRIIHYRPEYIDDFLNQKPKAAVQKITITDIFWPAFSADLSFYKKTSFVPMMAESMPVGSEKSESVTVHIKADIAFSKVKFGSGVVTFDYKFHWSDEKTEIKIHNGHILPEFEYVKTFFAKHFNSRTFQVLMVVTKSNTKIERIIATSRQIDQIRDVAIETMKFIRLERLKRPSKYIKEMDKSLFSAQDIFDPFDKNMLGTYHMNQKELFDHIMKWENIRNKPHLEYLSGHLHEIREKIRFTLTPKFGFLFVVHGKIMIHYIWEMLNTNATYIWSFEYGQWSQQKQLEKMEEVISFIRNHGRETYLRNSNPESGVLFRRILHQGAGSQFIDYFPRWRHGINEAMV